MSSLTCVPWNTTLTLKSVGVTTRTRFSFGPPPWQVVVGTCGCADINGCCQRRVGFLYLCDSTDFGSRDKYQRYLDDYRNCGSDFVWGSALVPSRPRQRQHPTSVTRYGSQVTPGTHLPGGFYRLARLSTCRVLFVKGLVRSVFVSRFPKGQVWAFNIQN